MTDSEQPSSRNSFDALLPPEMAARAEDIGVRKANADLPRLFALAFLAGAFIALGAIFATTVAAGSTGMMSYGLTRLLTGLVFSLGLILVIVGGAELFTGNNLIVMAWANGKITRGALLKNWVLVYIGNFAGAVATAGVLFASGQYTFGGGSVGATALAIAESKMQLGFVEAVALGALCNVLVCLAVWLTFSARTTTDRILAIIPPITAFVACGFEHCVANMYFIPIALFIKGSAPESFWAAIERLPADLESLTWSGFLTVNLLPVTIGNIIGGSLMVGIVYWFIYLRPRPPRAG